ncbi:hypothetical protein [Streptomyces sp. PD-S100-1]|uniref:hypothetical protein n=1 Tax=Streptomyces sp. PD-S100-1 TaxID=3394351 RepID=UPI0039BC9534
MTADLAAFVAEHPPRPGQSAAQMISTWEHNIAALDKMAANAEDTASRNQHQDEAALRAQLIAAVRWVQAHHGDDVADAFVTHLGDASSSRQPA